MAAAVETVCMNVIRLERRVRVGGNAISPGPGCIGYRGASVVRTVCTARKVVPARHAAYLYSLMRALRIRVRSTLWVWGSCTAAGS